MDNQHFHEALMDDVRLRAETEGTSLASAFLDEVAEKLVEAEEVGALTPVHFTGRGVRSRRLAVSAYDMDSVDDSVALAVVHFEDSHKLATLSESEANRLFGMAQNYIEESLSGYFLQRHEESTEEYFLADQLRHRGHGVTRYRLYLLTNMALSAKVKDFPSTTADGIPVEFHVWDVERLRRIHESTLGHEELVIDLREWASAGVPALKAPAARGGTTTYLCVLPVRLLGDLYARYGSRLLQSNVRSYLSSRGKINQGIRNTVMSEPELFLAYNNGITATATSVEESGSALIKVTDLQIVNGGQTTASLFYVQRENKGVPQFDEAFVQAKLVVVSQQEALALVPNISRFANSQNKVNESDFFSNSPFHTRLEEISRRLLAPQKAGETYQSKWFYERTRGQYANELAKLTKAEASKFKLIYPRDQVITKTNAAKYALSWYREPHQVSRGAQKNFVAFADKVAKTWEKSNEEINESYFKDLAGQAILYNSLRARIAKEPWYQSGYLANIVTYTIAKLADLVAESGQGEFNFETVWQRQAISEATMNFALYVAQQVRNVLVADDRPKENVTEWAKHEQCWKIVQALRIPLPDDFIAELIPSDLLESKKIEAKETQRIDNDIQAQTTVVKIPRNEWVEISIYALRNRMLSPTEASIMELVTRQPPVIPSEKQAVRLLKVRQRVISHGYKRENG